MIHQTLKQQFHDNFIAIVSLLVAIFALYHTSKLYEKAEINRNIRTAGFEVLMHLGELQQIVNTVHYDKQASQNTILTAWGHIALIGDLSRLMPQPVPSTADKLINAWKENYDKIKDSEESSDAVSNAIDATRQAVVDVISHLS